MTSNPVQDLGCVHNILYTTPRGTFCQLCGDTMGDASKEGGSTTLVPEESETVAGPSSASIDRDVFEKAMVGRKLLARALPEPTIQTLYDEHYHTWKAALAHSAKEIEALRADLKMANKLTSATENLIIGIYMGWDLEGMIEICQKTIATLAKKEG